MEQVSSKRLTFVTPSFEKHFQQFSSMVDSIYKNCIDKENLEIVVVIEEKNMDMFSSLSEKFKELSISIVTTESILNKFNIKESPNAFLKRIGKFTFQTLKKFGGILASNTHWSLVLDSETMFYNKFSASELLRNYEDTKYVFYTSTIERKELWKHSLGFRVNENTARALKLSSLSRWYMEIFHWFYEKDKVQDLIFDKLGHNWLDEITYSHCSVDYFECILYYAYLNKYYQHEYQFLNLHETLLKYVDRNISTRFKLDDLPFSLHGNDFILSIVGADDINKLSPFFEKFKLPLIRLEPAYVSPDYIRELKKLPYFCATVSSQYLMWLGSKIAICLSGAFKNGEFRGYEQQVRHILGFLSGVSCDLYIHGWKQSCEAYIIDTLKPKKYLFEEQINFKGMANRINLTEGSYLKPGRNEGSISMFYSMHKAFSLICNLDEYDYIVRLRPDIYSEFSLKELLFTISDYGDLIPNVVYIPSNFQAKGMNDQFAIGRSDVMKQYFSMYSHLEKNIDKLFFNPESMLAEYMIRNGVKISLLNMPYALHREEIIRPWKTLQLMHEQERVWWSQTTRLAKLQDVTDFIKKRVISGKLLNKYPVHSRFLAKVKNEKYMILVESFDFDPCVHARAVIKKFGMLFPIKMKNIKGIKSYEHPYYNIYYCIDINDDNELTLYQTISDDNSIKYGVVECEKFTLLKRNDSILLPVNLWAFIKSSAWKIFWKIRPFLSRYKHRMKRLFRI